MPLYDKLDSSFWSLGVCSRTGFTLPCDLDLKCHRDPSSLVRQLLIDLLGVRVVGCNESVDGEIGDFLEIGRHEVNFVSVESSVSANVCESISKKIILKGLFRRRPLLGRIGVTRRRKCNQEGSGKDEELFRLHGQWFRVN